MISLVVLVIIGSSGVNLKQNNECMMLNLGRAIKLKPEFFCYFETSIECLCLAVKQAAMDSEVTDKDYWLSNFIAY